jgi:hypothetical protein
MAQHRGGPQFSWAYWDSVALSTPSSSLGVCEYKPLISLSLRIGCFMLCCPSRRTQRWLRRHTRFAPMRTRPCLALQARRCCCSSPAFITPGTPLPITSLSRKADENRGLPKPSRSLAPSQPVPNRVARCLNLGEPRHPHGFDCWVRYGSNSAGLNEGKKTDKGTCCNYLSPGDYSPEKAGVGGSTPSLATIFSITCKRS